MPATNNEIRVVDNMLLDYSEAINAGFGFIEGDVRFLASTMIVISLVLAGLFWALKGEEAMVPFLRKVLLIGFFAFLINNWSSLMGIIITSFVDLGVKAGGNTLDANIFFSPGSLAALGIDYWKEFALKISDLTGPIEFFENIVPIIVLFLVGFIVIAAFFIMAIQVFVTLVMFKLVTLAAFVLVPFGLLKHTNFMSERALGLVVSYGLKFLTLSLIISIGYGIFGSIKPVDVLNLNESFSLMLASLMLMMLALHAPAVASELITGGPQLGAGAMAASAIGSAAMVGGAGYLAGRTALGTGRLAVNPLIRAANAGQISINGQPLSASNSASSLNTFAADNTGKGNLSQSIPTFHAQHSQADGSGQSENKRAGTSKGVVAGSAVTSSMSRNDSSGGISSTGSNYPDEGE
ncbi:MAG: P-type conjugative transfer protein TrbL [Alphaproteobacteria bacterium]